jgi:putative membrane protein
MIAQILITLVALIHIWFLVMEMALWETPRIRAVFGTSAEFAANTRVLAANMGLYNGFLAAGLTLALWEGVHAGGRDMAHFILSCVIVAGLYGAATAGRRILYVQAAPGMAALAALLAGV